MLAERQSPIEGYAEVDWLFVGLETFTLPDNVKLNFSHMVVQMEQVGFSFAWVRV